MKTEMKLFAALAAAGMLLFFYVKGNALEVGAGVGAAAVDLGAGVVVGIGDSMGLPRTDKSECEQAMAEGRTWDASFACPAATFARYVTGMGN